MKSTKILIAMTLSSVCMMASATEGKWVQGFGQGDIEYFIDKGNARLYIECPAEESNNGGDSTVSLFVNDKNVDHFKVIVAGNTYDGPFKTGPRYATNAFVQLIKDLNEGDAKVVYGKTTVIFPKSNVKSVLHTYMSGKFGCALN